MMELNTKRYFVSGYYRAAGRPKMEEELMRRTVLYYIRTIVVSRPEMLDFVMKMQDQLSAMNPCWKKVRICPRINWTISISQTFIHWR